MTAIELLKKYEEWEAKILNDENLGFLDSLSAELYNEFIELQKFKNDLLYQEAKEKM